MFGYRQTRYKLLFSKKKMWAWSPMFLFQYIRYIHPKIQFITKTKSHKMRKTMDRDGKGRRWRRWRERERDINDTQKQGSSDSNAFDYCEWIPILVR